MGKTIKNNGFTLIETMFVSVILGIVAMAFFHFMGSIGTAYKAQMDLEARVELFQTLNSMQRIVDCKTTVDSVSTGTTIPAEGLPIALMGSAAGGSTYISEFGGKKGRFSLLADIFPDKSIKIRAAAFKKDGALPRSRLSASDSEFLSKRSTSQVWSWTYTNDLIEKNFSSLGTICAGDLATAEDGGKISISCSTSQAVDPKAAAMPCVPGGAFQSYPTCYAIDLETGQNCRVDYKFGIPPMPGDPYYPGGAWGSEQGIIDMANCKLQLKGCPAGQSLYPTKVLIKGSNPSSYYVNKYSCK